jgi:hypothetical protein
VEPETQIKKDRGPVIGGVVFIVAGIFLLLEKTGYLPEGFVLHFWPMIFILIGLVKIVYAGGRATGVALIALGAFLQLNEMGVIHVNFWDLWPVFIIIAGVAMLWQALGKEGPSFFANSHFDAFYIFGGGDRQVNTKNFRGARMMAVFGATNSTSPTPTSMAPRRLSKPTPFLAAEKFAFRKAGRWSCGAWESSEPMKTRHVTFSPILPSRPRLWS